MVTTSNVNSFDGSTAPPSIVFVMLRLPVVGVASWLLNTMLEPSYLTLEDKLPAPSSVTVTVTFSSWVSY